MNTKCFLVCILMFVVLLSFVLTVNAETVFVKYRGQVDLKGFDCSFTKSSFVNRICYSKKNQYVIVLLAKTYYHYCQVPPSVVKQWLDTDSKGRFFNAYMRGNYDCRLGGVPSE